MNISERVYWTIIQRETGCPGCSHLEKGKEGRGVPCRKYNEWEGDDGCPFREEGR